MSLAEVTLDDKYELEEGRVFLTGIQALIRLPMMQRQRDVAAGLNTGCFISGYRGSPLGAYDQQLWQAKKFLEKNHIHFQPGVNEDLAATAVWGSQQTNLYPSAKYDGVFSIWYGKGPGVDRSLDVLKHMNSAGMSKHGGVLLLAGDDHGGVSSTLLHQSEHVFASAMIPVLHPANVQEYLDFGLLGWAMSRFAGVAVGFKCVSETVESAASVYIDPHRVNVTLPDIELPEGGLSIRWPDDRFKEEERLHRYKTYAAIAFARANGIDRIVIDSPKPRLGIITTGKSYLDVMQALEDLGIDEKMAADIGLRVYKVGMPWPLEPEGARHFAEGLEEVLVVEEKRALIENQIKEQLYNWREDVRPRVVGKFDENRDWLFPSHGELGPTEIARAIAQRLRPVHTSPQIEDRLDFLERKQRMAAMATQAKDGEQKLERMPYFCSGCPHNSSTRVPEGSRATAGIGCHFMAVWMNRETSTYTQMGGEGTPWIGQAPFTEDKHVFANLGDGTYFHSGLLAVRASAAAGVNITYKILYNDAVAMTGGQQHDGQLTPMDIAAQVSAENITKLVVVTDEPDKYPADAFPAGTPIHHRSELDQVQKDLRDTPGCTVLIYDQTCAAEKRRRRKRGLYPDPPKRAFINTEVCEGCGDCSVKSNCVSVEPDETEFGRKRKINQSSCNKDFSCVNGFCPSFVTVHGGGLRKPKRASAPTKASGGIDDIVADLPTPETASVDEPVGILVTGIGGTGVLTVGALLGMAAHLEGKGSSVLDYTGLAQKNGAVMSHVRIAKRPEDIQAVRIASGGSDLVLGCDMVVAASEAALQTMDNGGTRAIVNSHLAPTAAFTLNPDLQYGPNAMQDAIRQAAGDNQTEFLDATRIATALMGDSIATNLFMLGYAYQRGQLPVGLEAIMRAIELNGVAVAMNKETFNWGRLAAHDIDRVEKAAEPTGTVVPFHKPLTDLEDIVAHRRDLLTKYQDAAYADRYEALVRRIEKADKAAGGGFTGLAEAVARNFAKLMAYKDEYEVARLYTDGTFMRRIREQFEGDYKLKFHLAPPIVSRPDPETGEVGKKEFGPWVMPLFRVLAKMKGLRGTRFDIFGRTEERRHERQLIADYEALMEEVAAKLDGANYMTALELAKLPEQIKGYGHIKERNLAQAKRKEAELLAAFRNPADASEAAE
ncbi:MAG: indolepyruvate ferredoxin oxidoreductase [Rhizobiales bacterium NRL2]|jgi:indolepyruvate ferredoxin oxidoreductase|nr:MAG: indolepyruvate ferredoxin oxidoreductase [Rhizobiales bacterium NRL2]